MLKKLLTRWQELTREQRDFLDNTVPQRAMADVKYDFTKDETYLARQAEMATLEPQIAQLRAFETQERALDNDGQTRGGGDPRHGAQNPDLREYRAAAKDIFGGKGGFFENREPNDVEAAELRDFCDYVLTRQVPEGMMKKRTNLITTGTTTGGYGVPSFFSSDLILDLDAMVSVRRAKPQIIPISGDTNITSMGKVTALRIAEGATMTQTDPTVGRVTLSPHLLQANTVGSWAIFARFVTDLVSALRRSFAEGIAEVEGNEFFSGAGTTVYPQGLLVGGTSALTSASATTITAAELTSLWNALRPEDQAGATWFMNGTTKAIIAGLQDGNNNRIVQTNLMDGFDRLWGRPIVTDPLMPAPTATLKSILVANVPRAYVIGEEKAMTMLIDPYTNAGTNEQRIFMYKYNDARVRVASAAQYITMHA